MDDFELYSRFKRGDTDAFETLFNRYSPSLLRYLMKMLWDEDGAKDILQETFLRLFRSSLEERGKLSSWLFKVATNLAYRRLLERKRHISIDGGDFDLVKEAGHEDVKAEVNSALLSLPEPQRAVIMLKFYEGFRYKEIAEILGCPVGTVKSRMYYALSALRRILRGEEKDEGG